MGIAAVRWTLGTARLGGFLSVRSSAKQWKSRYCFHSGVCKKAILVVLFRQDTQGVVVAVNVGYNDQLHFGLQALQADQDDAQDQRGRTSQPGGAHRVM